MALLTISAIYAQETPGRKINDIKLSGCYFYAESTDPDGLEAKKAADTFLASYINQYVSDNGLHKEKLSPDNMPGVCYITMDRAKGKRVFAYVDKSAITGEAINANPTSTTTSTTPPSPLTNHDEAKTATLTETQADPEPIPQSDPEPAVSGSANTANEKISSYSEIRKGIIESLTKTKNVEKAYEYLNRRKAEYIVKSVGPFTKCNNKMWAFWLIYDSTGRNLEALLSPGREGERIDLLTGNEEASLDNYTSGQGKIALFFEFR